MVTFASVFCWSSSEDKAWRSRNQVRGSEKDSRTREEQAKDERSDTLDDAIHDVESWVGQLHIALGTSEYRRPKIRASISVVKRRARLWRLHIQAKVTVAVPSSISKPRARWENSARGRENLHERRIHSPSLSPGLPLWNFILGDLPKKLQEPTEKGTWEEIQLHLGKYTKHFLQGSSLHILYTLRILMEDEQKLLPRRRDWDSEKH